jgi:hypothetical protein
VITLGFATERGVALIGDRIEVCWSTLSSDFISSPYSSCLLMYCHCDLRSVNGPGKKNKIASGIFQGYSSIVAKNNLHDIAIQIRRIVIFELISFLFRFTKARYAIANENDRVPQMTNAEMGCSPSELRKISIVYRPNSAKA